jgi:hypothetical protein
VCGQSVFGTLQRGRGGLRKVYERGGTHVLIKGEFPNLTWEGGRVPHMGAQIPRGI